jgi:hypothetical protein
LDAVLENADLALLEFATKRPESDAILPVNESIDDNDQGGGEYAATDRFFETFDKLLDLPLS